MNMAVEHSSPLQGMWTANDKAVPLESIQVEAELALPVAITRQTQTYRNHLATPIEARYVFPVPLDAVLLGLEIRIGERVLHGVVKPKDEAERNYESAIVKGDSAFLLSRLDDGLYQISLGNILSGERVELTVTWAETLRWNGQDIRYRLPNLVGEHYGNPQRAGIAPENAPAHSSTVAYDFDLRVLLCGDLANASVSSPSHSIRMVLAQEGTQVLLDNTDWLDRSFTLVMHASTPPLLVAWSAPDGDNIAVMASSYPPSPVATDQPHHVTLLIDGSGSMEGVSIEQAKAAALEIVRNLRDQDTCSLAAFGTKTILLTQKPLLVGEHRQTLLAHCQRLAAELGGTEMQGALEQVMAITPKGGDILMVTDGQVYFSDEDIRTFTRHKRRLFTIGVGHSTSEKILRQLSEASGGFCELVSPNEGMANHIVSHFRRLRAPRMMPTYIWPGQVLRQDAPYTVFAGDTAILSARLSNMGNHDLRVNMAHADLKSVIQPARGLLASMLPRLVAARLLPADNIKQAREEAVQYQLVTEHTSLIAVMERDQAPDTISLPTIVDVPQMSVRSSMASSLVACMSFERLSSNYDELRVNENSLEMRSELSSTDDTDVFGFLNDEPDWLIDLSNRVENGESLTGLLVMDTLPEQWQIAVLSLEGEWPEDLVVLAIITTCLAALPASQLKQCRTLGRAVHQERSRRPPLDALLDEVASLQ